MMDRSVLEGELIALWELSSSLSRSKSTVEARIKMVQSCLDKLNATGHVIKVDRATSPIDLFRTDRSTSVSPHRCRSPVKNEEMILDVQDETIVDGTNKNSTTVVNKENSIECSQKKITYCFTPKLREKREEHLMERFNGDLRSQNGVSTSVTNKVIVVPANTPPNARKSFCDSNSGNEIATPMDVSQTKEIGNSKNPIQPINVQPNQQIEEDILYAMQTDQENNVVDTCSILASDKQEIIVKPSDEKPAISEQTTITAPLNQIYNVNNNINTDAKLRGGNRFRQAKCCTNRRKEQNEKSVKEQSTVENNVNNLNSILNGQQEEDYALTLRKDLIKKTYARGHRRKKLLET